MNMCQDDPLGRLIYMTTMAIKNYLDSRLKPFGLTTEQLQILKSLIEENGIAQNKLCEAVAKSPGNVTRILDRLEKKNYIERRNNPEDRRSSLVYLTAAGEEWIGQVRLELEGYEAQITAGLSAGQVQDMKDGLRTIYRNVEEITGESEK